MQDHEVAVHYYGKKTNKQRFKKPVARLSRASMHD